MTKGRKEKPPREVAVGKLVEMDWSPSIARLADPGTWKEELTLMICQRLIAEHERLDMSAFDYKDRGVSERFYRGLAQLRADLDLHEGPREASDLERLIAEFREMEARLHGGKPTEETPPTEQVGDGESH